MVTGLVYANIIIGYIWCAFVWFFTIPWYKEVIYYKNSKYKKHLRWSFYISLVAFVVIIFNFIQIYVYTITE